jgi:peptide/nickel transport system substrate-binding protein
VPTGPAISPTLIPPPEIEAPVIYREGLVGRVQRLNPLFAVLNPVDRDISSLIFEGLIGTNQYGEYVPQLAASWLISSDGLEYVFRLRQDVLWQDGQPFAAADVATTIGFLQAPGSALPEDLTAFWRTVELELVDEYTVRFRLAQPLAAFLDYLRIGMLPAHVFNGLNVEQLPAHPFNLTPIGTGPYQLERLITGPEGIAAVHLRVAPVYRLRPEGSDEYTLERLEFQLYESQASALEALQVGAIDGLGGVSQTDVIGLEQAQVVNSQIGLEPTVGIVLFNLESAHTQAFRDERARRALIQGADRIGLVNRHLSGQAVPADSPLIPGSWAYVGPLRWPDYNPQAARDLLSEISFAPPPTEAPAEEATPAPTPETESAATATPEPTATPLPEYDFALLCDDAPAHASLCQELAGQWAQLGLRVGFESVSAEEIDARLKAGEFDVALAEISFSPRVDPDPYIFWHQGQYQTGQNFAGVNDRRTSELLEQASRDPNGIHRALDYKDFQYTFLVRSLAMPLYYPVYEYAFSPRLNGVQLGYLSTPADRFRTIRHWQMTG